MFQPCATAAALVTVLLAASVRDVSGAGVVTALQNPMPLCNASGHRSHLQ
jgi:hypothetical protein